MTLRVGINGFGRIGRGVLRALMSNPHPNVRVAAVNDLAEPDLLAHLLRHDTMYGDWPGEVRASSEALWVNGAAIDASCIADPAGLDWNARGVDLVIEATGAFGSRSAAEAHIDAGARTVIISAPAPDADATILFGTNHKEWNEHTGRVISAGSCTAHAVAPLVTTLRSAFGWRHGHMTTVHPATPDPGADSQRTDWRLSRGSRSGVIPKSTSAVQVICDVIPGVAGRFDGLAYRVPTPLPGVIDLVVEVDRPTDAASVVNVFRQAAATLSAGVLAVSDEPLVASDYVGDPHSATVDAELVQVTGGTQVHVTAWYDNETGYAHRIVDLLRHAADHHAGARPNGHDALVCGGAHAYHMRGDRQAPRRHARLNKNRASAADSS